MIRTEVDLVEQDDRLGAAVPDHRQIALDATRIEVAIDCCDDECDVDVGSENLLVSLSTCGPVR